MINVSGLNNPRNCHHPPTLKRTLLSLIILSLNFKKLIDEIFFLQMLLTLNSVLCCETGFQSAIQNLHPEASQSRRTYIKYLQGLFHANRLLQKMGCDEPMERKIS